MRARLAALAAVVTVALTVAGSALAFDCVRVSSSLQGLQASTKSGNWLLFDFSSVEGLQRTLESIQEPIPTLPQMQCFVSTYGATGHPAYFAIGIGVAGPLGVLAHRNTKTMADGRGIDQLEASGLFAAAEAAAASCGIS